MDRWVISRMLVTTALKCCFKVELYYLLWGLNEAMQGKCPRDLLLPLGLSVSFRGRLGLRGCSQRPVVSERVRWEPCTAQDCWPSVVLCLSPVCENLSRGHKEYTPRCFDLKKKKEGKKEKKALLWRSWHSSMIKEPDTELWALGKKRNIHNIIWDE